MTYDPSIESRAVSVSLSDALVIEQTNASAIVEMGTSYPKSYDKILPDLFMPGVSRTTGIIGTGHMLPAEVISNKHIEDLVSVSDEWVRTRTGITERRRAHSSECASTLGTAAAIAALEDAQVSASSLDLIICTTVSPDMPLPSTACWIQSALGARKAACFDLAAACSGFLYGLEVADKLIKSGCYQKALVVSVDLMTRYTDYGDPQTAPLFGDGAGAVVLSPREDGGGLLASRIFSDGTLADLVQTPGGGTRHPCSVATLTEKMHFMKMRGNVLFKKAVSAMAEASQIVIEESGLTTEEIDLVIPHQGNQRITDAVAERLGVPAEKVYSNIARFGNTASASIPIAISECARAGRIKPGDTLLLTACGAGFTWGAAIMRW